MGAGQGLRLWGVNRGEGSGAEFWRIRGERGKHWRLKWAGQEQAGTRAGGAGVESAGTV